jgi:hypothetical protein
MLDALLMNTDPNQGPRLLQAYLSSLNAAQEKAWEFGKIAGAMSENERYSKQCDALIMAAGGEKALQRMMGILDDVKEDLDIQNEITVETLESIEA